MNFTGWTPDSRRNQNNASGGVPAQSDNSNGSTDPANSSAAALGPAPDVALADIPRPALSRAKTSRWGLIGSPAAEAVADTASVPRPAPVSRVGSVLVAPAASRTASGAADAAADNPPRPALFFPVSPPAAMRSGSGTASGSIGGDGNGYDAASSSSPSFITGAVGAGVKASDLFFAVPTTRARLSLSPTFSSPGTAVGAAAGGDTEAPYSPVRTIPSFHGTSQIVETSAFVCITRCCIGLSCLH